MSDLEVCRLHLQLLRHSLFSLSAFEYHFKNKAKIWWAGKLITEKSCMWGFFCCCFGFVFLIKPAEMLGENSEMGTPSSIIHAVEPLALTPLTFHPLYDYQILCNLGLYYFSKFCSVFSYPISSLCLLIFTMSCPVTESCCFYVCKLYIW